MTNVAFIGVGNMGGPMVRNLLRAGDAVRAFDLNAAALEPVVKAGAQSASTLTDAGADAGIVITMLPAGEHVRELRQAGMFNARELQAVEHDNAVALYPGKVH